MWGGVIPCPRTAIAAPVEHPPRLIMAMMSNPFPSLYKTDLLKAVESIDLGKVGQAIEILERARVENRQVFVCGNGGSFANASHFACEMVKSASAGRDPRFRVLCLGESMPLITAYSNDLNYEIALVEELKNFVRPGDIVIAFSGSGNSPNVLRVVEFANSIDCFTIAFSGRDGGKLGPMARLNLQAGTQCIGRAEDVHTIMMHMICYYFMENAGA
jgi:D-sedoheptulose 7-phosphate isomerase